MTSTTGAGRSGTGRPLSPAVYWRRRLFVLGTVVALVLIVVNLVGGGSDSTGPGITASNVGADQESAAPPAAPTAGPTAGTGKKKGTKERSPTTPEPTTPFPTPRPSDAPTPRPSAVSSKPTYGDGEVPIVSDFPTPKPTDQPTHSPSAKPTPSKPTFSPQPSSIRKLDDNGLTLEYITVGAGESQRVM